MRGVDKRALFLLIGLSCEQPQRVIDDTPYEYVTTSSPTICERWGGSIAGAPHTDDGQTLFNSTYIDRHDGLIIVCPLEKSKDSDSSSDRLTVRVISSNPNDLMTCVRTDWFVNANGDSVYVTEPRSVNPNRLGNWVDLVWTRRRVSIELENDSHQYGFYCHMPPMFNGQPSKLSSFTFAQ